jgi:cell division protease FtsH
LGNARNIAFWVVLFLLVLALFNMFTGGSSTVSQSNEVSYSDFVRSVESDEVNAVTLDGEQIPFLVMMVKPIR